MPGFSELTLHHSQHASSILEEMDYLRERSYLFCDCTLVVQTLEFPIHKLVLAASSEYFRALFTTSMKENHCSRIVLNGMSAQTFKAVLNFIYTGKVTLNESNITKLHTAADMLQLDDLLSLCHDYLLNQICTSNCIGIWNYSNTFGNSKLKDFAWWYIVTHFAEVRGELGISRDAFS